MLDTFTLDSFLSWLPSLVTGIIVLLVGLLIAKILEGMSSKGLKALHVNEKLGTADQKVNIEKIISKVVFYGIVLLTLIIFFNIMNLNTIATPFLAIFSGFSGAVLGVLKAGIILLIAWVVALLVKKLIIMLGQKVNLQKLLAKVGYEEKDDTNIVEQAANIVFYLILLLFMPAILHALGLSGVSGPFEGLLQSFLNFIPNLIGAALVFIVGYFIAKFVRMILTNFLQSIGTDRFAEKLNLSNVLKGTTISKVIGTIVFVLIMIPVTVSALEQLALRGISEPAISMLNDVVSMLPNIIVAAVLMLIAVWVAKWLKGIVTSLLENVGFNGVFQKIGVDSNKSDAVKPAEVVGIIVQVLVIFLFAVEALQVVNLSFMVTLATGIFAYLPMVLAALVILAVGYWLASMAERFVASVMTTANGSPHMLRYVAKYAILAFALFMALDQLGIARSIISSAFILTLGGVALAFGLAFGLGGREHAARYLSKVETSFEDVEVSKEQWEKEKEAVQEEMKDDGESTTKDAAAEDRYGNPFGDPYLDDENRSFSQGEPEQD